MTLTRQFEKTEVLRSREKLTNRVSNIFVSESRGSEFDRAEAGHGLQTAGRMRFHRLTGCVFVFPNHASTIQIIQSMALFDLVPCIIDVLPFLT